MLVQCPHFSTEIAEIHEITEDSRLRRYARRIVQQPNPALTEKIIGLGIKVHRTFGAGLLESVYNQCLCWEPHNDGLAYEREVPFAVVYQGVRLDKGFLADIVVENSVLLEIKYVERILPVHEAQTRTYLKLSGCRLALLMNFGTPMLKDGIRRFIN